jgi:hypothetical protein
MLHRQGKQWDTDHQQDAAAGLHSGPMLQVTADHQCGLLQVQKSCKKTFAFWL